MFEKTKKATIILGNIKTQKLAADKIVNKCFLLKIIKIMEL